MKKRLIARLLLSTMTAVCVLCACAPQETPQETEHFSLYYVASPESAAGGDAIAACPAQIETDGAPDAQQLACALAEALLCAPEDPELRSPFPGGTQLLGLRVSGKQAQVDLSSQYARLSGVELSLADYCLTLTLTQLDGVNAVSITANGRPLPYRKTQLFTAADTLLGSREDALRPITVQLYFLDTQTLALRPQQQTLALYEGQTRVNALLDALMQGPEEDTDLTGTLPEGFSVLSSRIDEGVCYLTLPGELPLPESPEAQRWMVESLVYSLRSLSGVEQVQFLMEGEILSQLGAVPLDPAQWGAEH